MSQRQGSNLKICLDPQSQPFPQKPRDHQKFKEILQHKYNGKKQFKAQKIQMTWWTRSGKFLKITKKENNS